MYKKSIFWFRQDLRTYDNHGLIECIENSHEVLPIFILDENLIAGFGSLDDQKFSFLREMLENLSTELTNLGGVELSILFGKPEEIIPNLAKNNEIEAIYCNRSYGIYGVNRDRNIASKISFLNIELHRVSDYLLVEPEDIVTRKVFTPYFRLWKRFLETRSDRTEELSPKVFKGIHIQE